MRKDVWRTMWPTEDELLPKKEDMVNKDVWMCRPDGGMRMYDLPVTPGKGLSAHYLMKEDSPCRRWQHWQDALWGVHRSEPKPL